MNPRWLVWLLNSKLASSGSVVSTTDGKRAGICGEYQLLDTVSGEILYLNLKEVEHLARTLGAHRLKGKRPPAKDEKFSR